MSAHNHTSRRTRTFYVLRACGHHETVTLGMCSDQSARSVSQAEAARTCRECQRAVLLEQQRDRTPAQRAAEHDILFE